MLDVLLPHYNDPEGLALSLRSIQRQTWEGPIRVVIADDGSRPDVKEAVQKIAESWDLNIDLIFNKKNRGRPYTRNVLLDSIQNDYVAWLDAGDAWYPKKLAMQFFRLAELEKIHIDKTFWVSCNYEWQWVRRRKKLVKQVCEQDQIRALLVGQNLRAYLWTLLGRAESFKNIGWFDERLPRLQDLDYFLRFVLHGGILRNVNGDGAYCLYHKSDIGRDADEIRSCNEHIYDKHRVLYNKYGVKFRRMRVFNMELLSARFAQNNSDNKLRNTYLLRAAKVHPKAFLWRMLTTKGKF